MQTALLAPKFYLKVTAEKYGQNSAPLTAVFLVNPASTQSARRMGEILAYITAASGFFAITRVTAADAMQDAVRAFGPDAAYLPVNNVAFIGLPFNALPTEFWRRIRAVMR